MLGRGLRASVRRRRPDGLPHPGRFRYFLMMILTRMAKITTMRNGSHACFSMLASIEAPVGPIPAGVSFLAEARNKRVNAQPAVPTRFGMARRSRDLPRIPTYTAA